MIGPPLTVVMPVRNCVRFLDEAIRSIVDQSHADFEFVIFDDASDDGSTDIIKRWADRDSRISFSRSDVLLGLAGSANAVVHGSSGRLIARMDADDISHPERLKRQLEVMQNDDVVVAGVLADGIDANGARVRPRDAARALRISHYAPFPNGSSMFRREDFEKVGGYREICDGWEDVDFFLRLTRRGSARVIVDPLYSYRYHDTNTSITLDSRHRLEGLAREFRCAQAYAQTGQYEDVVHQAIDDAEAEGFLLHSYAIKGALSVWAGDPPAGRLKFPQHPAPGWRVALVRSLLYRTWGVAGPRSLRRVQAFIVRLRDLRSMRKIGDNKEVEWRTRS